MTPSELTTLQWKVTHACIYEKHKLDLVGKVQRGYKFAPVGKEGWIWEEWVGQLLPSKHTAQILKGLT